MDMGMNGNLLISAVVCIFSIAAIDGYTCLLQFRSCSTGRLWLSCCSGKPRLFKPCCLGTHCLICDCF